MSVLMAGCGHAQNSDTKSPICQVGHILSDLNVFSKAIIGNMGVAFFNAMKSIIKFRDKKLTIIFLVVMLSLLYDFCCEPNILNFNEITILMKEGVSGVARLINNEC